MASGTPDFGPHGLPAVSRKVRDMVVDALTDERGVHLETAIAGLSAVAGTLILRGVGLPLSHLPEGSPVLCEEVNEAGPHYITALAAMYDGAGFDSASGWGNPVPENHRALRSTFELTKVLEPRFVALCEEMGVPAEWRAKAALFSAVRLVDEGKGMLSPDTAKGLMVEAMVAGSKTVPPRSATEASKTSKPKSFWGKLFGQ